MKIRALDSNDDWTFGKSKSNYLSENNAIRLDTKTALLCWLNDCFFDAGFGIDWHARLEKGQEDNLRRDILALITSRDGVIAVKEISVSLINRVLNVSYDVSTIYTSSLRDNIVKGT